MTAIISLPNGGSVQADFAHPLTVPSVNRPTYLQGVIAVLREIVGADGMKAQAAVNGTIGMRDVDDDEPRPPLMRGVVGLGEQIVIRERLLFLRWIGGVPPFRVQLIKAEGANGQVVDLAGVSDRSARLNISNVQNGLYWTPTGTSLRCELR